ncbi:hypothetical protein [Neorickettsia sennetsu]|uniref:hypothetical protein n=1 Tax=Ehrlichia sennetsu TaxID=951 RepID=UPI000321F912|nr:hypothetical protein [Neorickettsia sennetsu]
MREGEDCSDNEETVSAARLFSGLPSDVAKPFMWNTSSHTGSSSISRIKNSIAATMGP